MPKLNPKLFAPQSNKLCWCYSDRQRYSQNGLPWVRHQDFQPLVFRSQYIQACAWVYTSNMYITLTIVVVYNYIVVSLSLPAFFLDKVPCNCCCNLLLFFTCARVISFFVLALLCVCMCV